MDTLLLPPTRPDVALDAVLDVDDEVLLAPCSVILSGSDRFGAGSVVQLGGEDDAESVEFVDALVARAAAAVELLQGVDSSVLSADALTSLAFGAERLRRQVEAIGVGVAARVDTSNPFRTQALSGWRKPR